MPPRKKAKASAASTPLTETQPKTPQDSGPVAQSQNQTSPQNENLLNDPWTDDQETQLFKSMIKWKPTGLHKHFRMLSIHNNMRSHGFVTDDAPHTRIPGVWRKLHQLYDLPALDERENVYIFHDHGDPLDAEEAHTVPEFELPEDEFGDLLWQRRFHGPNSVGSSSPPFIPTEEDKALYQPGIGLLRDLPGGVKSQKAESASGSTPKNTKNTRASRAAAKSGKGTRAGQGAKGSKAQSAVSESAEEDEEDEDDEEDEESTESQAETAPSTRRTNRSTGRAKPAPKRTRKR